MLEAWISALMCFNGLLATLSLTARYLIVGSRLTNCPCLSVLAKLAKLTIFEKISITISLRHATAAALHFGLSVDVADLQVGHFCAPRAGGIKRQLKDAMKGESAASIGRAASSWLRTAEGNASFSGRVSRCCSRCASTLNVEEPQSRQP
jgi:hypothetical protein